LFSIENVNGAILNTQDADECMDILMLAKYLEKIGDHAFSISESLSQTK